MEAMSANSESQSATVALLAIRYRYSCVTSRQIRHLSPSTEDLQAGKSAVLPDSGRPTRQTIFDQSDGTPSQEGHRLIQ